jgi:hypothetical protein
MDILKASGGEMTKFVDTNDCSEDSNSLKDAFRASYVKAHDGRG